MKVANEGYFAEGIAMFSLVCWAQPQLQSRHSHGGKTFFRKIIWCPLADFRGSAEAL